MDQLGVPGQPFGASAFPRPRLLGNLLSPASAVQTGRQIEISSGRHNGRFREAKTGRANVGFWAESGRTHISTLVSNPASPRSPNRHLKSSASADASAAQRVATRTGCKFSMTFPLRFPLFREADVRPGKGPKNAIDPDAGSCERPLWRHSAWLQEGAILRSNEMPHTHAFLIALERYLRRWNTRVPLHVLPLCVHASVRTNRSPAS
jgi:hypothetical protein